MNYRVTKNFNKQVLSWNDIFYNFEESVANKELIKYAPTAFYVIHNGHRIKKLKNILKKLDCRAAHIYFNLCAQEINFGRHNDDRDVWFWQCQGKSKWLVENKEFILAPGDLIYIKKGVYHDVSALSPRAGVSMSEF